MSNKKLIAELMGKLKTCEDPVQRDEIEDQILLLVEQDEEMDKLTKPDLDPDSDSITETDIKTNNFTSVHSDNSTQLFEDELDPKEKIRQQRNLQKDSKEARYKAESKLESVDEELLRTQLMNEALATNEDYAFQKTRKHQGSKNKNRKPYKG
jgi:hypothetical protein